MATIMIDDLLADHHECLSDFQIDHFIVGTSCGTAYGSYKQCLRELKTRYNGLYELEEELADQRAEIEGLEAKGPDGNGRELRRQRRRLAATIRSQADTQREYDRFLMHARRLKAEVGELTPEKRAVLDRDMWAYRLRAMATLDAFMGGLSHGTAEAILKCPPDVRAEIVAGLPIPQPVIAWLQTSEAPRLPGATVESGFIVVGKC